MNSLKYPNNKGNLTEKNAISQLIFQNLGKLELLNFKYINSNFILIKNVLYKEANQISNNFKEATQGIFFSKSFQINLIYLILVNTLIFAFGIPIINTLVNSLVIIVLLLKKFQFHQEYLETLPTSIGISIAFEFLLFIKIYNYSGFYSLLSFIVIYMIAAALLIITIIRKEELFQKTKTPSINYLAVFLTNLATIYELTNIFGFLIIFIFVSKALYIENTVTSSIDTSKEMIIANENFSLENNFTNNKTNHTTNNTSNKNINDNTIKQLSIEKTNNQKNNLKTLNYSITESLFSINQIEKDSVTKHLNNTVNNVNFNSSKLDFSKDVEFEISSADKKKKQNNNNSNILVSISNYSYTFTNDNHLTSTNISPILTRNKNLSTSSTRRFQFSEEISFIPTKEITFQLSSSVFNINLLSRVNSNNNNNNDFSLYNNPRVSNGNIKELVMEKNSNKSIITLSKEIIKENVSEIEISSQAFNIFGFSNSPMKKTYCQNSNSNVISKNTANSARVHFSLINQNGKTKSQESLENYNTGNTNSRVNESKQISQNKALPNAEFTTIEYYLLKIGSLTTEVKDLKANLVNERQKKKIICDKLAHELKTPLNSIKNFIQNLNSLINTEDLNINKASEAFPELTTTINDLNAICLYTTYITSNILDLSNDNQSGIQKNKINIASITDEMFQVLSVLKRCYFNTENIELETIVSESIDNYNLITDEKIFTEILVNLISNAVKYTKAGCISLIANIEFNEDLNDNIFSFSVKDTGKGIADEVKKDLFETDYNENNLIKLGSQKVFGNFSLTSPSNNISKESKSKFLSKKFTEYINNKNSPKPLVDNNNNEYLFNNNTTTKDGYFYKNPLKKEKSFNRIDYIEETYEGESSPEIEVKEQTKCSSNRDYFEFKIGLKKSIKNASILGCHLEIISEENSGTEIIINFPPQSLEKLRSESKISTIKDNTINLTTAKSFIDKFIYDTIPESSMNLTNNKHKSRSNLPSVLSKKKNSTLTIRKSDLANAIKVSDKSICLIENTDFSKKTTETAKKSVQEFKSIKKTKSYFSSICNVIPEGSYTHTEGSISNNNQYKQNSRCGIFELPKEIFQSAVIETKNSYNNKNINNINNKSPMSPTSRTKGLFTCRKSSSSLISILKTPKSDNNLIKNKKSYFQRQISEFQLDNTIIDRANNKQKTNKTKINNIKEYFENNFDIKSNLKANNNDNFKDKDNDNNDDDYIKNSRQSLSKSAGTFISGKQENPNFKKSSNNNNNSKNINFENNVNTNETWNDHSKKQKNCSSITNNVFNFDSSEEDDDNNHHHEEEIILELNEEKMLKKEDNFNFEKKPSNNNMKFLDILSEKKRNSNSNNNNAEMLGEIGKIGEGEEEGNNVQIDEKEEEELDNYENNNNGSILKSNNNEVILNSTNEEAPIKRKINKKPTKTSQVNRIPCNNNATSANTTFNNNINTNNNIKLNPNIKLLEKKNKNKKKLSTKSLKCKNNEIADESIKDLRASKFRIRTILLDKLPLKYNDYSKSISPQTLIQKNSHLIINQKNNNINNTNKNREVGSSSSKSSSLKKVNATDKPSNINIQYSGEPKKNRNFLGVIQSIDNLKIDSTPKKNTDYLVCFNNELNFNNFCNYGNKIFGSQRDIPFTLKQQEDNINNKSSNSNYDSKTKLLLLKGNYKSINLNVLKLLNENNINFSQPNRRRSLFSDCFNRQNRCFSESRLLDPKYSAKKSFKAVMRRIFAASNNNNNTNNDNKNEQIFLNIEGKEDNIVESRKFLSKNNNWNINIQKATSEVIKVCIGNKTSNKGMILGENQTMRDKNSNKSATNVQSKVIKPLNYIESLKSINDKDNGTDNDNEEDNDNENIIHTNDNFNNNDDSDNDNEDYRIIDKRSKHTDSGKDQNNNSLEDHYDEKPNLSNLYEHNNNNIPSKFQRNNKNNFGFFNSKLENHNDNIKNNLNNIIENRERKIKELGNSSLLTISSSYGIRRKSNRFNTVRNSLNKAEEFKLKISSFNEKQKTIELVIIDDNTLMRSTLKKNISEIISSVGMKSNIREGKDGVDLLKIIVDNQFEESTISLILCDESMDYINGSTAMTLLKTLESMNKIKKLPMKICVTAFQDEDTVKQIRESGFDLIMDKNPKKQQLINLLNDLDILN